MSKKESDILLIRKYLAGELDARAMHQLERRALSDPFLMDALEGYENAGTNQQAQLREIGARLRERVGRKERRIFPISLLAIAASILIVFTVGGLWLFHQPKQSKVKSVAVKHPDTTNNIIAQNNPTATNEEKAPAVKPAARHVQSLKNAVKPEPQTIAFTPPVVAADKAVSRPPVDSARRDTTPLNEMIVMNYTSKRKADTISGLSFKASAKSKPVAAPPEELLKSQVAGVTANNTTAPHPTPGTVPIGRSSELSLREIPISKEGTVAGSIISGKVTGANGQPLPGASVRVAGTNIHAVTNAKGFFSLPADSSKTKLLVGYKGYKTAQYNAAAGDSLNTMSLQPSISSLAEVEVAPYGNSAGTGVMSAHPQDGWSSFRKYLKQHAVSPDSKKGIVKLSIAIGRDGRITDVKVKKGLSPATDQAAVNLVKNGPKWTAGSKNGPEAVTLRIRFGK